MGKTAKVTISIPKELLKFTDKMAEEKKTNRSQVISECIREILKRKKEEDLKEGYLAMAEEHKKFAALVFEAQREILPEWKQ